MRRNTSVALGDHFEGFVETRIVEGRYKNASEVIRAGLRLLEEEESKIIALKNAINEGIVFPSPNSCLRIPLILSATGFS